MVDGRKDLRHHVLNTIVGLVEELHSCKKAEAYLDDGRLKIAGQDLMEGHCLLHQNFHILIRASALLRNVPLDSLGIQCQPSNRRIDRS